MIGAGFFVISQGNPVLGHKMIGLSVLFLFFIIMPLFIWTRYKNKDFSKFTFTDKDTNPEDDDTWDVNDKSKWN